MQFFWPTRRPPCILLRQQAAGARLVLVDPSVTPAHALLLPAAAVTGSRPYSADLPQQSDYTLISTSSRSCSVEQALCPRRCRRHSEPLPRAVPRSSESNVEGVISDPAGTTRHGLTTDVRSKAGAATRLLDVAGAASTARLRLSDFTRAWQPPRRRSRPCRIARVRHARRPARRGECRLLAELPLAAGVRQTPLRERWFARSTRSRSSTTTRSGYAISSRPRPPPRRRERLRIARIRELVLARGGPTRTIVLPCTPTRCRS